MIFLPNLLTLFRLFISPVGALCLVKEKIDCALFILLFAAFTDFLDGFLARRLKAETDLGKLLDPVADKVLVFSYLVALYVSPSLEKPSYFLLSLLIVKELFVVVGGLFFLKLGEIPTPTFAGKVATNFLFWYLVVYLIQLRWEISSELLKISEIVVYISLVGAIFSYFYKGLKLFLKYLKSDGRENRH